MRCIFASECPDFLACNCRLFSLSQPCCQLHVMLILSHIRFSFRTEVIIRQLYFFTDMFTTADSFRFTQYILSPVMFSVIYVYPSFIAVSPSLFIAPHTETAFIVPVYIE
ncbi:hypothetical protein F6Z03_02725 [Salmonella enterica]|nr:hypothetical protein [Salmonella enterica]ECX9476501.1 hypothetical protein [Salmonella enterica]EDR1715299.1 hypothetical protein [Salmonella enterica subsp. enterica serovar Mississippi]RBJ02685.1 hypothetical protein DR106_19965 [Escherichia coli]